VVGPTSATDNAVARYDTTTGKLIQNSLVIIDDTGSVTGVNALTAESLTVNNNSTLGFSNTDTLDVRARIISDLEPNVNNAKDIGTNGRNWRDGFFGRNLDTVNLSVTGTTSFDGAQGTSGQVLTSAGTGNTPTWTTPTVGTVTSVGGTGTVNGITLTGTVTTSGNLTLGGTLSGVSLTTQVSGTLPVANGGTGTATAFTAGSVVFAGASGVYSQDNASLFFDNTNDRLGIGTSSPSSKLTVGGNPPSAGALAAVGAAAGISLALSDNINCSLYVRHPAAGPVIGTDGGNALRFATNGNAASDEKMRIDSSGNVGIGVTNPASLLSLQKSTAAGLGPELILNNSANSISDAMALTFASGAIGVGARGQIKVTVEGNPFYGAMQFFTGSSNATLTERMRITGDGNLLIGTTGFAAGQNAKHIAPSVILTSVNTTAATGQIVFYNPNGAVGQIYTDGATTVFATSSDYRLKEITGIVTATEAKDFIMALQPKQGTWKIDGSKFVGFLAHEFKNVSPSSVFGEKDAVDKSNKPVYQGMQAASSEVMANLIALVQEQQALITQLQTDVATLKGN
jgi:hypothetical protein